MFVIKKYLHLKYCIKKINKEKNNSFVSLKKEAYFFLQKKEKEI